MLNTKIGSVTSLADGRQIISTRRGEAGHALYGPYELIEPGQYIVEFEVNAIDAINTGDDPVLGEVDVVSNHGAMVHARADYRYFQVRAGEPPLRLAFIVDKPGTFQYRVATNGIAALKVTDFPVVAPAPPGSDALKALEAHRFPRVIAGKTPAFFTQNVALFRSLHQKRANVRIDGEGAIVTINGVAFNVRTLDDLFFVPEVFFRNTYNLLHIRDTCIIDIGMNIGLVTLSFAGKDFVKEVHSFEPFQSTYNRAVANFALNPAFANKITAHNFGLASEDQTLTVLVAENGNSGSSSVRGASEGSPVVIHVRKAGAVLAPIIHKARSKDLDVIAKIDCEGSEFEIFDELSAAGLWRDITALMVEWHHVVDGKTQKHLIAILQKAGFSAIDLSPPRGNGIFYAVKTCATA